MSRYARVARTTGYGVPIGESRLDAGSVDELLELSRSGDALVRRVAVKNMCTCHVRADDERVWPALLRLFDDPDPGVRRDALHALTDSTPRSRTAAVAEALESRYNDPDPSLRRRIRRTLMHYRRTGRIDDGA